MRWCALCGVGSGFWGFWVFGRRVRSSQGIRSWISEPTFEIRDAEDVGGRRWTDQDHQGLECGAVLVLPPVLVGLVQMKVKVTMDRETNMKIRMDMQ